MISLSDNETERLLRLMSLLSSSKFPAFSASKYLQNSSIIQNNSGFFSNFSTKPHILYEGAIFLRKFNIKN